MKQLSLHLCQCHQDGWMCGCDMPSLEYSLRHHFDVVIFSDSVFVLKLISFTGIHASETQGRIIKKMCTCVESINLICLPRHFNIDESKQVDQVVKLTTDLKDTFIAYWLRSRLYLGKKSHCWYLTVLVKTEPNTGDWPTPYGVNWSDEISLTRLRLSSTSVTHFSSCIINTASIFQSIISYHVSVFVHIFTEVKLGFSQGCKTRFVINSPIYAKQTLCVWAWFSFSADIDFIL